MSKKYNKRGAGLLSSIKSTMTSMTLTCHQIWDKYSSQLKSLVDEIDTFYTANDMKNLLQTLYKTDYVNSKVLDEFGSIKLQVQYLFDVMSGVKQSLSDPQGKMCSDFVHSDFGGKKAALTFDQYLQDLEKKLSKIRETMTMVITNDRLDDVTASVTANTSSANTSSSNTSSSNTSSTKPRICNKNSQKKGWLSSTKDKIASAMPKTCAQLWEIHIGELKSLVQEIQIMWDANNMEKVLAEEEVNGQFVGKQLNREQYDSLSNFPIVKNRLVRIEARMTNEKFDKYKNNRMMCLYFIPEPDFDDFNSFDSYLKTLKEYLLDARNTMQKIYTSTNVVQVAGKSKRSDKSYIIMKGKVKQYLIHKDTKNHKYIRKNGNNLYLSDIRGKYMYVRD